MEIVPQAVGWDVPRGEWMESEIREQPEALAREANRYFVGLKEQLAGCEPKMILIAARGSSDNAAVYARYLFEINLRLPVCLSAPSVLTRYGASVDYPKCLAIGISQSGAAPDVAEVLIDARGRGHRTLAITNTPDSRLAHVADSSLHLGVGPERAIAATKTYSATLLALYQLARALGADLPDPEASLPTPSDLHRIHGAAEASVGALLRNPILFALGRGYDFCTALDSALKLMECALLPCKSYSTADFQHGPRALAKHGSTLVCFGEPPPGVEASGAELVRAPSGPGGPLEPIHGILFGQWLALMAARARGLDPDTTENLSKITKTL